MLVYAGDAVAVPERRGLYSLSGSLGLRWKEYAYETDNRDYSRSSLRQEVGVSGSGFVWDPRFMAFDASATYNEEEVEQTGADRGYTTTDYRLSTTWFPESPSALTLYGGKSTNEVRDEATPAHEVTSRSAGGQWAVKNPYTGQLRFSFNQTTQRSDSTEVPTDEKSRTLEVKGKRQGGEKGGRGGGMELDYGYRYTDNEDAATGRQQQQHYWYGRGRTRLSDSSRLNADVTLYDRQERWTTRDAGRQSRDSLHLASSAGLSVQHSEATSSRWSLSLNRNDIDDNENDTYSGSARVDHRYDANWTLDGSARLSLSRRSGRVDGRRRTMSTELGADYTNRFGSFRVRGGGSIGAERVRDDFNRDENALSQSLNLGYSRRDNPLYADSLSYRTNVRRGRIDSVDHRLRYRVNSRIGLRDRLTSTAEVRRHEEQGGTVDRDTSNKRASLRWSRRLYNNGTFSASAGWSQSTTRGFRRERRHVESTIGFSPPELARLRLTGRARYEKISSDSRRDGGRTTLDTSANYTLGRWEARAEYRYRREDEKARFTENELTLYLKRRFSTRI